MRIRAPSIAPSTLKSMSMSLPNRELLSLRPVFALPKDSKIGFTRRMRSSTPTPVRDPSPDPAARPVPATPARYLMAIFVVSVLSAPDSPPTMSA